MIIEVRKDYLTLDGEEYEVSEVFSTREYGVRTSRYTEYKLDFRKSLLAEEPYIEIRNKSGHNLDIIGENDWHVSLKTSQAIVVEHGIMEYMSQYNI